ncbi:PF03190 family protein [Leptospira santarosai str. CBC523]|uniref:tetratricopeptide repeat protein n=1 Tax=Leptospira santarosai TaxID=28183 RepID=UPI0002BEF76D|nr:tetratricopeptide repeat protein [Leptospira santarosai]EMO14766.1 PF03190 family protein [Leptospira santarosai str. CBC523]
MIKKNLTNLPTAHPELDPLLGNNLLSLSTRNEGGTELSQEIVVLPTDFSSDSNWLKSPLLKRNGRFILGRVGLLSFPVFVLFCIVFCPPISAEIQWEKSVKTAFEKAKTEGKPIFIDVYADWCGYCKTLKNEIYPKKEVQLELSKFVALSLDGDTFPNLKRKYGIKGYPSILFLDKNGSLIDKITGMPDSKMILKLLKNAYSRKNLEKEYLEKLAKDPNGVKTNFQTGVYYFEAKEYAKAVRFFQKAIDTDDTRNTDKKHDALFNLGISYLEVGNFKSAIATFNSYISRYPNGDLSSVLFFRANAYEELNQKEEAKADYKKVLELTTDPEEKRDLQLRIDSLN